MKWSTVQIERSFDNLIQTFLENQETFRLNVGKHYKTTIFQKGSYNFIDSSPAQVECSSNNTAKKIFPSIWKFLLKIQGKKYLFSDQLFSQSVLLDTTSVVLTTLLKIFRHESRKFRWNTNKFKDKWSSMKNTSLRNVSVDALKVVFSILMNFFRRNSKKHSLKARHMKRNFCSDKLVSPIRS